MGGDGGAGLLRVLDRGRDQFGADTWTSCVVDEDNIRILRRCLQPFQTESCRSAPPTTIWNFLRNSYFLASAWYFFSIPARTTMMISSTILASSNRLQVWATTGLPATQEEQLILAHTSAKILQQQGPLHSSYDLIL